ncbi:MAG: hypothetical protein KY463_10900, partial [Actinobacteria bacterium]|nr:hypothetical protein [Actinomycetota bacterium]
MSARERIGSRADVGALSPGRLDVAREIKPGDAVDLREALPATRPRRPFDLERAGHDRGRVEVALQRERDDALAGLLADLAELDRRPVGRGVTQLLGELAQRAGERVLAGSPGSSSP